MTNIEYARSVLLQCPAIEAGPFDVAIEFLGEYAVRYALVAEPGEQVVQRYTRGATVRRFPFTLEARYSAVTDEDRAANSQHYEDLSLWLERVTRRRGLPPMDAGKTPVGMAALGSVYVESSAEDGNTKRYLMQMELTYRQEGGL